jgi:2-dehydro-3-deoxy-D-pentonate aldolase
MKEFRGIFPALVSPFTQQGALDPVALRWLCRNCVEKEVDGLILGGSLGEFPNLTFDEKEAALRVAIDEVNGKIPILAGANSASTDESIRLAKMAKDVGADAALVLPPFYFQVTDEAVFRHFDAVAHAVDLPVMVYNFPGTTKVNLTPPFIARLAHVEGIVGVKNSVDSVIHLREIVRLTKGIKGFSVLAGMEDYLIPGLLLGAHGSVSGLSNFVPQVLVNIYRDFVAGNIAKASETFNTTIVPLKALAPPPEPISALKIGASLVGPVGTRVRLPLLDAPAGTKESMSELLADRGLLPPSYLLRQGAPTGDGR